MRKNREWASSGLTWLAAWLLSMIRKIVASTFGRQRPNFRPCAEIVYPASIHLLDLCLFDETGLRRCPGCNVGRRRAV